MEHRTKRQTSKPPASAGTGARRAGGRKGKAAKEQPPKRFHPWVLIPLALGAVLLGVLIWLVIFLSQRVAPKQEPVTGLSIDGYLEKYWDKFRFESSDWDEQTGTLTLKAAIDPDRDITLAQAQKYALLDGVRFDELALSDAEDLHLMLEGWDGDRAVGVCCGIDVKTIVFSRVSCEGEIIYTVDQNGVRWVCWQEP